MLEKRTQAHIRKMLLCIHNKLNYVFVFYGGAKRPILTIFRNVIFFRNSSILCGVGPKIVQFVNFEINNFATGIDESPYNITVGQSGNMGSWIFKQCYIKIN